MPYDFRVQTGLYRHPKFLRLLNQYGAEAALSLHRLWAFCAEHKPTGLLRDLDATDLATAAGWTGKPETFVAALINLRFLDQHHDGHFALHNWELRQPWVVHAPDRSAQARRASNARWGNPTTVQAKNEDAPSTLDAPRVKEGQVQKPGPKTSRASDELKDWFEREFKPRYPKHRQVQGTTALAALRKLKPNTECRVALPARLDRWKLSEEWTVNDGKYIPGMGNFLTDTKYESDPSSNSNGASGLSRPIPTFDELVENRKP